MAEVGLIGIDGGVSGGESPGPVVGGTAEASIGLERSDAVQDESEAGECDDALAEVLAENAALRVRLEELEATLASLESRGILERLLLDAGVIDLETALALAEPRLRDGEAAASIAGWLTEGKPFLFHRGGSGSEGSSAGSLRGSSTSPGGALRTGPAPGSLSAMASEARRTGDRQALTRYLRQRRQG